MSASNPFALAVFALAFVFVAALAVMGGRRNNGAIGGAMLQDSRSQHPGGNSGPDAGSRPNGTASSRTASLNGNGTASFNGNASASRNASANGAASNAALHEQAVRLVFESGRPLAHVARDLGVDGEALAASEILRGASALFANRLEPTGRREPGRLGSAR